MMDQMQLTSVSDRRTSLENARTMLIENVIARLAEVSFTDEKPWVLELSSGTVRAFMHDPVFIEKIESGCLRFGRGDILRVDLELKLASSAGHQVMSWTIRKVHALKRPRSSGCLRRKRTLEKSYAEQA